MGIHNNVAPRANRVAPLRAHADLDYAKLEQPFLPFPLRAR